MEYFKDFLKSIDLSKMFNIPWLTDSYSKWVIIFIVWGLFWGITCRIIVSNKGYEGSWFAWGFIFGPIAFLFALAKPVYQPKYDSFSFNESMNFLQGRQSWECPKCHRSNSSYTGTCGCGYNKLSL